MLGDKRKDWKFKGNFTLGEGKLSSDEWDVDIEHRANIQ